MLVSVLGGRLSLFIDQWRWDHMEPTGVQISCNKQKSTWLCFGIWFVDSRHKPN